MRDTKGAWMNQAETTGQSKRVDLLFNAHRKKCGNVKETLFRRTVSACQRIGESVERSTADVISNRGRPTLVLSAGLLGLSGEGITGQLAGVLESVGGTAVLWPLTGVLLVGAWGTWTKNRKQEWMERLDELQEQNIELKERERLQKEAYRKLQFAHARELEAARSERPQVLGGTATENGAEVSDQTEKNYQAVIRALPDVLFTFDWDGRYLDCLAGEEKSRMHSVWVRTGKKVTDILAPEEACRVLEGIQRALRTGKLQKVEYVQKRGRELGVFELRLSPSADTTVIGLVRDVTTERAASQMLANEKEVLRTTLLSLGEGVITTDNLGRITLMNAIAEEMSGWEAAYAVAKPLEDVLFLTKEGSGARVTGLVERIVNDDGGAGSLEGVVLHNNHKKQLHLSVRHSVIRSVSGAPQGVVFAFRDVTSERSYMRQIEFLSYRDPLTGIYNRRYFTDRMNELDVPENLPLTMVMADVNGLKLTNDAFGHKMGDDLLIRVAQILEDHCRPQDVLARLGGDEFVILMPGTPEKRAQEILHDMKASTHGETVGSVELSISFGFDTKTIPEQDMQEVFNLAEDLMYKNKLFEGPSMRGKTISAIINTLHEKNAREEEHSQRVGEVCEIMGQVLGLSDDDIYELKSVGLLHDIGKVAINESILNKPDVLDLDERKEIKRHPEIGYRILSSVNDMADMAESVLYHHERWDGNGYPKGLAGQDIPQVSRILHLADAFDAMISKRAYREGMPLDEVMDEIRDGAGTQFDPELTVVFLEQVIPIHLAERKKRQDAAQSSQPGQVYQSLPSGHDPGEHMAAVD